MDAVTPKQAAAWRRLRMVALWAALVFAVVGTAVCLLTSRGTTAFHVGANLVGLGVGLAVAVLIAVGLTRLLERPGRAQRR